MKIKIIQKPFLKKILAKRTNRTGAMKTDWNRDRNAGCTQVMYKSILAQLNGIKLTMMYFSPFVLSFRACLCNTNSTKRFPFPCLVLFHRPMQFFSVRKGEEWITFLLVCGNPFPMNEFGTAFLQNWESRILQIAEFQHYTGMLRDSDVEENSSKNRIDLFLFCSLHACSFGK